MTHSPLHKKLLSATGRIWHVLRSLLGVVTPDDLASYMQSTSLSSTRLGELAADVNLPNTPLTRAYIEIALWIASDILLTLGRAESSEWLAADEITDDEWYRAIGCLDGWWHALTALDFAGFIAELTIDDIVNTDDHDLPRARLVELAAALKLRDQGADEAVAALIRNMISYLTCADTFSADDWWLPRQLESREHFAASTSDYWLRATASLVTGFSF